MKKTTIIKTLLLGTMFLGGASSVWAEVNTDANGRKQYVWNLGCEAKDAPGSGNSATYYLQASASAYVTDDPGYGNSTYYDYCKVTIKYSRAIYNTTTTNSDHGAGAVLGNNEGTLEFYAPIDGVVTLTGRSLSNATIENKSKSTKTTVSGTSSLTVAAGERIQIYASGGMGVEYIVLTQAYYGEIITAPTAVEYQGTSIVASAGTASWSAGKASLVSSPTPTSTIINYSPETTVWYASTEEGEKTEITDGSVTPGSTGTYYVFTKSASGNYSSATTCAVTGYITETYDFTSGTPSSSATLTKGNKAGSGKVGATDYTYYLPSEYLSVFNNRFAMNSYGSWKANSSDGLKIYQGNDNAAGAFFILGLKAKDKIAVNFTGNGGSAARLKVYSTTNNISFSSDATLVTATEYTVTSDGDLGMEVHTGSNEIKISSVTIKHPVANTPNTKTISNWGWVTYSSQQPVKFGDNVTAYIVTNANASTATLEKVSTIRPYTGVLLKGTASTKASIAYADNAGGDNFDDTSSNLLVALPYTPDKLTSGYVLSATRDANSLGFYKLTSSYGKTPSQYTAYLPESAVPAAAREFIALFDDGNDAAGISNVSAPATTANQFYSLSGVRVDRPQKGLYIINGKKVIIK